MTRLTLDNLREVAILQPLDVGVHRHRNELHFEYIGLHNTPLSARYPLCKTVLDVESDAKILGDGFQMLAQTAGTVSQVEDVGRCPDNNLSYRIYAADAPKRFYNYLVIEHANGYLLFGFTSCQRFAGYFEIEPHQGQYGVTAYLDGEGSEPQSWASNRLESVVMLEGESLPQLYRDYVRDIHAHHPPRPNCQSDAPVGWCSWYAYYADVNEQHIRDNVDAMQGELDALEWVLLDDGYQAFMGDWLTPSTKFSDGVKQVVASIRQRGKKPAIWMAPFIAEPNSTVFRDHPEWFVRHADGTLLKAEDVTYGGWRCTPWYILDGSNPHVQEHLTQVVRTMREEWGIELFKLDANYWGTLKGKRYQAGVTGVEAYRMGMQAIIDGAQTAWILGCNAPMWPSLGLVDAMRVSDDVERHPHRFHQIARETFYRSWQHRQLWQIDPDCLTLTSLPNQATDRNAYEFHRNVILSAGGLLLSGDPLPELTAFAKTSLQKLIARHTQTQETAKVTSLSLNRTFLKLNEVNDLHCLFNFGGDAYEFTLIASQPVRWYDFWSGESLSDEATQVLLVTLPSGLHSRAIVTAC